MIKIQPLADRLIVRPDPAKDVTEGDVIIPDSAQEKPLMGEVMTVGPGRMENGLRIPMEVSEGDRVMYGKYSGKEITDGVDIYLLMKEADVDCIIEEVEAE